MDFNDYLNDLLGNNPVLQEDSSKIDFENIGLLNKKEQ